MSRVVANLKGLPSSLWAAIHGMSLRSRITAITIGLLVLFIWILAIVSAQVVQERLEQVLSDQQLAATRRVARTFDDKIKERVDALSRAAASLPADLRYTGLQPVLEARPLLQPLFTGGTSVIGLDGIVIADYPVAPGSTRHGRE